MNQKGEVTLFSTLLLMVLMGIVLLCALELRKSFLLLEKRTHLFLCVKETKGELNRHLKFMGRSNWAIKNINRLSLVMMFIPGLQGVAANAEQAKEYLKLIQNAFVVSHLKSLMNLKQKGCPLDPRMITTPFKLGAGLLDRDNEGAAQLRDTKWTYYFLAKPYLLTMEVNAESYESIKPRIKYKIEEKAAKLSSLLSSR
jgi:hypothetical protein